MSATADLVRFKTALKVTCNHCGNASAITGFDVIRQFGTMATRLARAGSSLNFQFEEKKQLKPLRPLQLMVW